MTDDTRTKPITLHKVERGELPYVDTIPPICDGKWKAADSVTNIADGHYRTVEIYIPENCYYFPAVAVHHHKAADVEGNAACRELAVLFRVHAHEVNRNHTSLDPRSDDENESSGGPTNHMVLAARMGDEVVKSFSPE